MLAAQPVFAWWQLAYALTVISDNVRMGTTIVSRNGVG